MSFWKRFVGVALLLALGFLSGASVSNILDLNSAADDRTSCRHKASPLSDSFYSGLDLTEQQWSSLEKVLEQCRSELSELRKGMAPRIHEILFQAQSEIEPLLTGEQRASYKAELARWEELHRRHVQSKKEQFGSRSESVPDSR